jgi:hypothetical protein
MSMFTKEADLTTEAGFILAFNIAKAKNSYTEGEFIKKKHGSSYFGFRTGK